MILGFKRQFVDAILIGRKRHTIRSGQRWTAGMRADLYQNVRQKNQTLLFRAPVTHVQSIELAPLCSNGRCILTITIDGETLTRDEAEVFAFRDGFEANGTHSALEQMALFWSEHHAAFSIWKGQIVHWDFKRRES